MELTLLNPKALERQLKALEGRIQEVQREMDDLERKRRACLILMGQDIELEPVRAAAAPAPIVEKTAKPVKKKAEAKASEDAPTEIEAAAESEAPPPESAESGADGSTEANA
jgi:hypothetical protein